MSEKHADILIIEDARSIALVYQSWLKKIGLKTCLAEDGETGLEKLRAGNFKLALLDLDLPGLSGLELLRKVQQEQIETTIVVVTASGSVTTAIEAMRSGAYDFLVKPTSEERLLTTARNAVEREVLNTAVKQIRKSVSKKSSHGFIGSSLPMLAIYRAIDSVAQSKVSVFITGESGTGKEVCAEAIHQASQRQGKAFVPLNCAAIPKDLMESEIFGHISGAFTGATSDRAGAAVSANGGTLFLDEICEMDLNLQSKLLRFLQTGVAQKVGSDRPEKVDVRIICATNRDPAIEVQEGRFREDLYYRLHVLPIHLPPLRERGTDAVEIAAHFLETISKEEGKSFFGFSADAEDALLSYGWPGNIRELQNVVRKAVILNDGDEMNAATLSLNELSAGLNATFGRGVAKTDIDASGRQITVNLEQDFSEIERDIMEAAIAHCGNSIPKASAMLNLSPSTIYRKRETWDAAEFDQAS